jgi:uncharacterized membrane protein YkoI
MLARSLLCLLCCLLVPPAQAATSAGDDAARVRAAVARGEALPLPRILDLVRRRITGEIIGVELQEIAARLCYAIMVLAPDGQLRAIRLDARTGATLAIDAVDPSPGP